MTAMASSATFLFSFSFFLLARTTPICIISKFSLDLAPARLDDDDDDNFHHKVFTHYFSLFALLFSTTTTTRFPLYVSHYPLPISSISSTLCIFPLFTHFLLHLSVCSFFPFGTLSFGVNNWHALYTILWLDCNPPQRL